MAESGVTLRVEAVKPRGKGEGSDDNGGPDLSTAPIFADLAAETKDELDHVMVERVAPVHEGQLGRFEPDVTELDIFERHGGGKYRIQGRTKGARPIKGAYQQITLAGEPLLKSKLARRTYANMTSADGDAGAATPAASSMQDMLAVLEQTRSSAEAERERRADEEEKRHKREIERLEREAQLRAKERADEDERRRKEEDAREERRKRDEEDRRRRDKEEAAEREAARKRDEDERRSREKREEEERRQRDREWQVTLAQMNKGNAPAADPIGLFTAGISLAQKLGGGAAAAAGVVDDPLTALAANLPATVTELGKLFRGGGGAAGGDPNDLTLQGPLGELGNRAVKHLQAQGLDAGGVLVNAFNLMLTMKGPGVQQQQPAQPAAAGAPAPPRRGPGGRPMPPRAAPAPAPSSPANVQPVNAAAAKDGFVPTPSGASSPG